MKPFSEPYEHSGPKRRGINSVEQGVAVLQAVVELRAPASLKEISRLVELDSGQTHRYVSSLVNCGMLRQDRATGLYELGPTSLRTGLAALARLDPITQVDRAARGLVLRSGGTVLLSVWAIGGATIIRWYPGTPPVYTMLSVGSVLPLTASATGKVFLAFLPDSLVAPVLEREGGVPSLNRNAEFLRERESIRSAHLATVDGKVIPGLRAVSAPVLGAGAIVIATLTIIASDATPPMVEAGFQQALLETCRELTLDLGGLLGGAESPVLNDRKRRLRAVLRALPRVATIIAPLEQESSSWFDTNGMAIVGSDRTAPDLDRIADHTHVIAGEIDVDRIPRTFAVADVEQSLVQRALDQESVEISIGQARHAVRANVRRREKVIAYLINRDLDPVGVSDAGLIFADLARRRDGCPLVTHLIPLSGCLCGR